MVVAEWKLCEDEDDILWIDLRDGALSVILETEGFWKLSPATQDAILDGPDRNVLFNNWHNLTDTRIGKMVLNQYRAEGSPSDPINKKHYKMKWAPVDILFYYKKLVNTDAWDELFDPVDAVSTAQ